MPKLAKVDAARALMTEATSWSVMKWLREKKTVRCAADEANAALDQLRARLQQEWPESLQAAYQALAAQTKPTRNQSPAPTVNPEAAATAGKIKEADEEAHRARMDAEDTFDQAEKQLSTALAREGCRKAIHSWDLHEKAIRQAEAVRKK